MSHVTHADSLRNASQLKRPRSCSWRCDHVGNLSLCTEQQWLSRETTFHLTAFHMTGMQSQCLCSPTPSGHFAVRKTCTHCSTQRCHRHSRTLVARATCESSDDADGVHTYTTPTESGEMQSTAASGDDMSQILQVMHRCGESQPS